MIDQKVVVLATGGTIAMKYDPKLKGLVPACTGEDLAAAVPGLGEVAPLEFIQFSNVASPAMTPQTMWDLHVRLEKVLARDDVAAASSHTAPIHSKRRATFWICCTRTQSPS